jgi:hypothetical protein
MIADERLVVVVGNSEQEHGRTRVELDASGSVSVTNEQAGKETALEGRVEPEEAVRVLQSVPEAIRTAPEKRLGIPDEARYRIELIRDGKPVETVELWESQLEDTQPGRSLLSPLRRIVGEVSDRSVVL